MMVWKEGIMNTIMHDVEHTLTQTHRTRNNMSNALHKKHVSMSFDSMSFDSHVPIRLTAHGSWHRAFRIPGPLALGRQEERDVSGDLGHETDRKSVV